MQIKLIALSTALFAFFIGWVIYKADTGQPCIFLDLVKIIPYGDKIGHFFLFGILAFGANLVFKHRGYCIGSISLPYGAMLIFCIDLVEELSQQYIPGRTFDFIDLMATLAGIVVFSIISYSRLVTRYLAN